jgi:hypothetical protein
MNYSTIGGDQKHDLAQFAIFLFLFRYPHFVQTENEVAGMQIDSFAHCPYDFIPKDSWNLQPRLLLGHARRLNE